MLALFIRTRTAWNDYFTGSPIHYQSNQYGTRQTPSDTNVHVLNCLFKSIGSTNGHGGALSCTSATFLLVESSSLAVQAMIMEEPFTSLMVMVNVFWIKYVVITVIQHTQVLRMANFCTHM
jgi:hypothetical protein